MATSETPVRRGKFIKAQSSEPLPVSAPLNISSLFENVHPVSPASSGFLVPGQLLLSVDRCAPSSGVSSPFPLAPPSAADRGPHPGAGLPPGAAPPQPPQVLQRRVHPQPHQQPLQRGQAAPGRGAGGHQGQAAPRQAGAVSPPLGWAVGSALVPWAADTCFYWLVWCGEQEGSDSTLSTLS